MVPLTASLKVIEDILMGCKLICGVVKAVFLMVVGDLLCWYEEERNLFGQTAYFIDVVG